MRARNMNTKSFIFYDRNIWSHSRHLKENFLHVGRVWKGHSKGDDFMDLIYHCV